MSLSDRFRSRAFLLTVAPSILLYGAVLLYFYLLIFITGNTLLGNKDGRFMCILVPVMGVWLIAALAGFFLSLVKEWPGEGLSILIPVLGVSSIFVREYPLRIYHFPH